MVKDVICDENELSIAVNNIVKYSDFLSRTIDTYISILGEIQEKGIHDDLICAKLSLIAQSLKPYKILIAHETNHLSSDVKQYVSDVAQLDNFKFPNDVVTTIASILSIFR